MNEPGAEAHLLNDIRGLEAGSFRWTRQQPTLQFQVTSTRNQRLKFDFALNSNVLAKTGPITVSYFVNGNLLERVTYTKDGEQHYEKRVPARFLSTDSPVIVSAELDKVMETPDGGKLGLVLTGAGFVE